MKRSQFFFEADAGGGTGGAGTAVATGGTLLGDAGGGSVASSQQTQTTAWNWASEDGKFSEDWHSKLPDDIKGHDSLKVIGTVQDLAKSYVHTKGMVGKKLEMPAPDAPAEAIAHWRKVTGAPETPEGYLGDAKTLKPENMPAELWDAESEKGFLAIAHKYGLPPAAVKEIAAFDAARLEKALGKSGEQETVMLAQEKATLEKEWGADYQKNVNIVARMAATMGLKTDNPIFTNAEVVKAFHRAAALFSEDKLVKGDASTALGGSISERIADITNPTGTSHLARAYRGELGPQEQTNAQQQLHALYTAQQTK